MKATTRTPRPEYLLTGLGRCWVCYEHGRLKAGFCGVRGGSGLSYYRCATVRDRGKLTAVKMAQEISFEDTCPVGTDHQWESLLDAHSGNWKAEVVEDEIDLLVSKLVIPQKWYDMIYAYYLHNNGIAEFERETYNLRKELERLQRLFTAGYLSQAQFEERAMDITQRLKEHEPSCQPGVREILPFLSDFSSLWKQLNLTEKKALLKVMYMAIYFDQDGKVRKVLANNPFQPKGLG